MTELEKEIENKLQEIRNYELPVIKSKQITQRIVAYNLGFVNGLKFVLREIKTLKDKEARDG